MLFAKNSSLGSGVASAVSAIGALISRHQHHVFPQELVDGKKYEMKSSNGKHVLHINDVQGVDEGKYSIHFLDTDLTSTANLGVKGQRHVLSSASSLSLVLMVPSTTQAQIGILVREVKTTKQKKFSGILTEITQNCSV